MKKIKILDIIIVSTLIIFLSISAFVFSKQGDVVPLAVLVHDGQTIWSQTLAQTDNQTIDLLSTYNIPAQIEIRDSTIRFINVQCPDHLCENVGAISKPYQSAVCMPNKLALSIYDQKNYSIPH